jgi:hypothetical protein
MDPVHPWGRVALHIVDRLVLIFIRDARKRKGVIDGSTVIAKRLPKLARDADAAKGRAVASEQGLNLFWEGFADGFEADRVVFAAVVKRDRARTASLTY